MFYQKNVYFLVILLILAHILLFYIASLVSQSIIFGSEIGGWYYPYKQKLPLTAIFTIIDSLLIITLIYFLSLKFVNKLGFLTALILIFLGFIYTSYTYPRFSNNPGLVIISPGSSPFLNISRSFSPKHLVSSYHNLTKASSPGHFRANMPGKILFYYPLRLISNSNHKIWLFTVLISSLSGILIYYFAEYIFKSKSTALLSLALYLTMPARLYFAPLLNTVSPLFGMFPLVILIKFLESKNMILALLLGTSIYLMAFFEPMLFVLGFIGLSLIIKNIYDGKMTVKQLIMFLLSVFLSFTVCYFLVLTLYNFDLFRQYIFIMRDSIDFNRLSYRPFKIWVFQNPIDFIYGAGVLPTGLFLISLVILIINLFRTWLNSNKSVIKQILSNNETLFAIIFLITMIFVDFFGIARGETTRLWIFLMVFIQILAARYAVISKSSVLTLLLIWGNVIQSILTLSVVKFI